MKILTSRYTSGDLLPEKQRLAHEEALRLLNKELHPQDASSQPAAAPSGDEVAPTTNP